MDFFLKRISFKRDKSIALSITDFTASNGNLRTYHWLVIAFYFLQCCNLEDLCDLGHFVLFDSLQPIDATCCRRCFHVCSLQWRHKGRDSLSNHQPHDCFLNRLSKKTSKVRVTGLCAGIHRWPVNSPHKCPVTRKVFPFDDVIIFGKCLGDYSAASHCRIWCWLLISAMKT